MSGFVSTMFGAAADLRARLAGGVAVVDRGPQALAEPEARERARLVLRQRLGRVEVERARVRRRGRARPGSAG